MNAPMQLYRLTDDLLQAQERLAELDLPDEVVHDTLEGLQGELTQRAEQIVAVAKNFDGTAAQIEEAIADMSKRAKAYRNRAEHIREYVKANMERAGIQKIESPWYRIAVRTNPAAVVILDASAIPPGYMRYPEAPPPAPDKKAIAEAWKAGEEVPGTTMKQTTRLEVR